MVSHRTLQVDRAEEVAGEIRRALKYIAPEQLIVSSDCGFGRQGGNRDIAFFKSVVDRAGAQHRAPRAGPAGKHVPRRRSGAADRHRAPKTAAAALKRRSAAGAEGAQPVNPGISGGKHQNDRAIENLLDRLGRIEKRQQAVEHRQDQRAEMVPE